MKNTPETVMCSMMIKESRLTMDVKYIFDKKAGRHRLFTDDLKYGSGLEIVFSNRSQCFVIKGLDRLRMEWNKLHSDMVRKNAVFEKFLEVKV